MDPTQIIEGILSFSLAGGPRGDQGYSRVLLQLFGCTGHGKSAFINSCKYVLEDTEELISYAEAGERYGGITMERRAYELTNNITIVDNRGYSTMNSFQKAEMYAQLGNFIPIGERVEWLENYSAMMNRLQDAELNPNYSDFIVPILIYRAACTLSEPNKKEIKTFMENCMKMTGVVPIVVITHKKTGNYIEIENMFKLIGGEVIIPIENYTQEDQIKTRGRTTDILMVIDHALKDVRYRLGHRRDPRRDWVQRKKFLLNYIHKAHLEKREHEIRREEEMRRQEEQRQIEEEKRREEERKRKKEMEIREAKQDFWLLLLSSDK